MIANIQSKLCCHAHPSNRPFNCLIMACKHLKILLLIQVTTALITKNFVKVPVNPGPIIVYKELIKIPLIQAHECAYFCMKEGDGCQAFYITDQGSCRQVPLDLKFKVSPTITNNAIVYATQNLQFSIDESWLPYKSKCYNILEDVTNYFEAKSKCEQIQAKLFEPFNEDEYGFVLGQVEKEDKFKIV